MPRSAQRISEPSSYIRTASVLVVPMVASNNSVKKALSLLQLLAGANRPLRFTDMQASASA